MGRIPGRYTADPVLRRFAPLLIAASLLACAPRVQRVTMEPLVIRAGPDGETRAESPDPLLDELAAMQERGECETAIPRLERFVEDFPESGRFLEAVMRLGLCHAEEGHARESRSYFRFVGARAGGPLGLEAGLRAAYALEMLGDFGQAAREYRAIARSRRVPGDIRAGARLRRAVCLFREDEVSRARRELTRAMRVYATLESPPVSVRSAAAEAHFMAAERRAREFRDVRLEYPQPLLEKRMAGKMAALAGAREAYGEVVQFKDPEWAAAAVFRIGEMLERLHRELVEVPPPPGLEEHHHATYAGRLVDRVKPLQQQALESYLQVVSLGERVGLDSPWVAKARGRAAVLEEELKHKVLGPGFGRGDSDPADDDP